MENMTNINQNIDEILLPDGSTLSNYLFNKARATVTHEYVKTLLDSEDGPLIKEIKKKLRPTENSELLKAYINSVADSEDRSLLLWQSC